MRVTVRLRALCYGPLYRTVWFYSCVSSVEVQKMAVTHSDENVLPEQQGLGCGHVTFWQGLLTMTCDSRPPAPVFVTPAQRLMSREELLLGKSDSPWSCFHHLSCCAHITPTPKCICHCSTLLQ
ncbi:hypothetical protein PAMP_019539 [Pampus punctatissimus]